MCLRHDVVARPHERGSAYRNRPSKVLLPVAGRSTGPPMGREVFWSSDVANPIAYPMSRHRQFLSNGAKNRLRRRARCTPTDHSRRCVSVDRHRTERAFVHRYWSYSAPGEPHREGRSVTGGSIRSFDAAIAASIWSSPGPGSPGSSWLSWLAPGSPGSPGSPCAPSLPPHPEMARPSAMMTLNNNRPTQIFLPVMTVTLSLHPVSEVLSFYVSRAKIKGAVVEKRFQQHGRICAPRRAQNLRGTNELFASSLRLLRRSCGNLLIAGPAMQLHCHKHNAMQSHTNTVH